MRELLKLILSVQMFFAPVAFAQIPPPPPEREAEPDPTAPAEPPRQQSTREVPDAPPPRDINCPELKCTPFVELQGNIEAQKEIAKQLGSKNNGRACEALKERAFLERMIKIYEAQPDVCLPCIQNLRKAVARSDTNGSKGLREIGNFLACKTQRPAPVPAPPPPPREPAPPVYEPPAEPVVSRPPRRSRPSSYVEESVDTGWGGNGGGGGGFGNFFGGDTGKMLGAALVGGIFGYALGSRNQQQQQPYWQQMPYGPQGPYGQVPPRPFGPQQPFRYPGIGGLPGQGGFPGQAPTYLPYGGPNGQLGGNTMMPIGGYQGGVGLGNYNLGSQFGGGCGFCTGGAATGTSWGGYNAPVYLPYGR